MSKLKSAARRVLRPVATRVRRPAPAAPEGIADLIHAIKNEVVGELSDANRELADLHAGQRSLHEQQAVTAARLEGALVDLAAAREEIGWARTHVVAEIQQRVPNRSVGLRLADVDQSTADFLNYAGSHGGPLADVGLWINDPVVVQWMHGDARVGAVNERIVEQPFVQGAIAALTPGAAVVDVGGSESVMALALASLGYSVTVVDPAGYPFEHPNLSVFEGPLEDFRPDERVDAVVLLSAIEHFGIGAYRNGPDEDPDADLAAMDLVHDLLSDDGVLVLTTPFGPWSVNELERTYDEDRLRKLLSRFEIDHVSIGRRIDDTTWIVDRHDLTTPEQAGNVAMVRARRTS